MNNNDYCNRCEVVLLRGQGTVISEPNAGQFHVYCSACHESFQSWKLEHAPIERNVAAKRIGVCRSVLRQIIAAGRIPVHGQKKTLYWQDVRDFGRLITHEAAAKMFGIDRVEPWWDVLAQAQYIRSVPGTKKLREVEVLAELKYWQAKQEQQ